MTSTPVAFPGITLFLGVCSGTPPPAQCASHAVTVGPSLKQCWALLAASPLPQDHRPCVRGSSIPMLRIPLCWGCWGYLPAPKWSSGASFCSVLKSAHPGSATSSAAIGAGCMPCWAMLGCHAAPGLLPTQLLCPPRASAGPSSSVPISVTDCEEPSHGPGSGQFHAADHQMLWPQSPPAAVLCASAPPSSPLSSTTCPICQQCALASPIQVSPAARGTFLRSIRRQTSTEHKHLIHPQSPVQPVGSMVNTVFHLHTASACPLSENSLCLRFPSVLLITVLI